MRLSRIINKSYSSGGRKKAMLVLAYQRGGMYKAPKNKLNLEDTRFRKWGCLL